MRSFHLIAASALLVAACGRPGPAAEPQNAMADGAEAPAPTGTLPDANGQAPAAPAAPAQGKEAAPAAAASAAPPNPCMVQGTERLTHAALRAVGTEPFWGAQVEGRCVTYSHPEDQQGTRIWARYAASPGGGSWTGTLAGKPFVLTARAAPGCSDNMSDRRYPVAVELTVAGQKRTGCAARL